MEAWVWWITFTPLHLLWAGKEAVYVFFVLSGFVLALPFIANSSPNWAAYIPRRLFRIYPPVWASLLIALLSAWVFRRAADPTFSWWVNLHDEKGDALKDSALLLGTSSLNSPLWSLQWEIVFSLLLPLFVVAAISVRSFWVFGTMTLILLIGLTDLINMVGPTHLPIFGVGVLMAARRDKLHSWATKFNSRSWGLLFVASVMLLTVHWVAPQFLMARAVATLGGAVLVFIFIGSKLATNFGKSPAVQWLGTRSFSLYLIHEPVVMAVAFGLKITDPLLVMAIAMPTSLVMAELFFCLVERPCHRLSVIVGRAATKWTVLPSRGWVRRVRLGPSRPLRWSSFQTPGKPVSSRSTPIL